MSPNSVATTSICRSPHSPSRYDRAVNCIWQPGSEAASGALHRLLLFFVCDTDVILGSGVATAHGKDADAVEKNQAMKMMRTDCLDAVLYFVCCLCRYDLQFSPSSPCGADCGYLPLTVLSDIASSTLHITYPYNIQTLPSSSDLTGDSCVSCLNRQSIERINLRGTQARSDYNDRSNHQAPARAARSRTISARSVPICLVISSCLASESSVKAASRVPSSTPLASGFATVGL